MPPTTQPDTNLPATANEHAKNAATLIYSMEKYRLKTQDNTLSDAIYWLRDARSLADINLDFYKQNTPFPAEKIQKLLKYADQTIQASGIIQSKLLAEMSEISEKMKQQKDIAINLDEQLFGTIQQLAPQDINDILKNKIEAEKKFIALQSQLDIRETLIKNMRGFETNLRSKVLHLVSPQQQTIIQRSPQ